MTSLSRAKRFGRAYRRVRSQGLLNLAGSFMKFKSLGTDSNKTGGFGKTPKCEAYQ